MDKVLQFQTSKSRELIKLIFVCHVWFHG